MNAFVRKATSKDIDIAFEWAKELGWALSGDEGQLKALFEAYGALVVEDGGEVIGVTYWPALNDHVGMACTVIVRQDYRGKGIGKLMIKEGFRLLGDRNVFIQADLGAETFYMKAGLSYVVEYRWYIFTGDVSPQGSVTFPEGTILLRQNDVDVEDLAVYERGRVGLNERRNVLFSALSKTKDAKWYAAKRSGNIVGVLLVRPCPWQPRPKWKVQILAADDAETAIGLLGSAMNDSSGELKGCFHMATPHLHDGAKRLVDRFNLQINENAHTLFSKSTDYHINLDHVYAFLPF